MNDFKCEAAWSFILESLGIDLDDENFKETPVRITKMYNEIFAGLLPENMEALNNHLSKTFPCSNDEMVTIKGVETWSTCPHHFLPVHYWVDVAYLPKDKVLGLSKLPRVVDLLAKRPVLQEQYTQDIVNYLEKTLTPRGVAVKVRGVHLCMVMRGIKSFNSEVITSSMTGAFKESLVSKQEFLQFVA
jgi:GTP cyclohydrolase I